MRIAGILFRLLYSFCIIASVISSIPVWGSITNLTNNDVNPLYSSVFPQGFMTRNMRYYYIDEEDCYTQERIQLSISGYRQWANCGTNICKHTAELGDLTGRWAVPPLFYPEEYGTPYQQYYIQNKLFTALNSLTNGVPNIETDLTTTCSAVINPAFLDKKEEFGFFTVPIKYRKYGIRFQLDFYLFGPLMMRIQTGVADIKQVACMRDLTCTASGCPCLGTDTGCSPASPCIIDSTEDCNTSKACVDTYSAYCKAKMIDKVMKQKQTIADVLRLNIDKFENRGMEDTRFQFLLRHVFPVNSQRKDWTFFLFMPYFSLDINAPTGTTVCPGDLFALPTGNNGYTGVGFTTGFTADFIKTLELGAEAGVMQYNTRVESDVPVPATDFQNGFYSRKATLRRTPGITWNFTLSINAYHFLEKLSAYVQYVFNGKGEDKICVVCANTAIQNIDVKKLEENAKWESQLVNVGFTYDLSPNLALGFAWQAPGPRRNAYKSNTVLVSLVGTF